MEGNHAVGPYLTTWPWLTRLCRVPRRAGHSRHHVGVPTSRWNRGVLKLSALCCVLHGICHHPSPPRERGRRSVIDSAGSLISRTLPPLPLLCVPILLSNRFISARHPSPPLIALIVAFLSILHLIYPCNAQKVKRRRSVQKLLHSFKLRPAPNQRNPDPYPPCRPDLPPPCLNSPGPLAQPRPSPDQVISSTPPRPRPAGNATPHPQTMPKLPL